MTYFTRFMRFSSSLIQKPTNFTELSVKARNLSSRSILKIQFKHFTLVNYCYGNCHSSRTLIKNDMRILLGASIAFLGFLKKDEEKEPELITTIKRSILSIQRGEFKKAEQLLHVALRQAQSLQSEEGITYIYDIMANLAFQVGEFDKAENLFKSVMQRLLSTGTPKDDLKIIHMSLKMSKILENKEDFEKAEIGYKHCESILKKQIDSGTDDVDVKALWALNLDWYAHFLLSQAKYTAAFNYMKNAYEMCLQVKGRYHEQTVVLLNDLGSIMFMQGKYDEALDYLNQAIKIGDKLADMEDLASIYVNLGNIYIKKGLLDEAKKSCAYSYKLSKYKNNNEVIQESKKCLDDVQKLLKN